MKNRQATRMFGMTVMGGITVNGDSDGRNNR